MVAHTEMELLVGGICRAQFRNIYRRPKDPTTKSGIMEGLGRPRGFEGVSIGESFNGASLSKIVSYVRSYIRCGRVGIRRKGMRVWTRRETGTRENGARLAFANPAARGPELFPGCSQNAFTDDNNRRHSTRNVRGNACDSATAESKKRERRINSALSTRCPGYYALATNVPNARSQRFRSRLRNPTDRMEQMVRDAVSRSSGVFSLKEKFSRTMSFTWRWQ